MRKMIILALAAVIIIIIIVRFSEDRVRAYIPAMPIFELGHLLDGTDRAWVFREETDNTIARVRIDAQGTREGAAPDSYTELDLRAQDEIHDPTNGTVAESSDIHGRLRVMSDGFGATSDTWPHGHCRGSQCPDTTELVSDRFLRLTASSDGAIDFVTSNGSRLVILPDGTVQIPGLANATHGICTTNTGVLIACP